MNLFTQLLAGTLAAFIAWTLVRAWRNGEIISNFRSYSADDRPLLYAVALVARVATLGFFILLSAGFTVGDISRLIGLNNLAH